jgi:hypothetical protein
MDAAATRRASPRFYLALALSVASLGLGGCESGASLFSGGFGTSIFGGGNSEPQSVANAAPPAATQQPIAKIALLPIVGAPESVARQIELDFTGNVVQQRVAVATTKNETVDYTLRGYLVAAKEKNNTKVSYIWDVTDPSGKRVNRVTGEEVLPGGGSKDPWAALTPQVTQTLAAKAATSFTTWLNNRGNPSSEVPVASSGTAPASGTPLADAGQGKKARQATASLPQEKAPTAEPAAAKAAVASPAAGQLVAVVPRVQGAPGDGSQSLSEAIRQELQGRGVGLVDVASANTYRVEGIVKLGDAKDGKQAILIEWQVKDPKGKKLGTVSQRNEIPAGSLDGEWGATAQQAAGAAVQGIVKLLPQKTAAN